ncbi:MAG TPA: SIR2 family protein [Flavipsychrobacter sp.]|jgi:hypothetical protein|nr:SIR2 family protein [Flavipsychrobacter sp.]
MAETVNLNPDKVYVGGINKLKEWPQDPASKVRALLKNYLELDNVSFLFGAGSSINLGSISIAGIPPQIVTAIANTLIATDEKKEGEDGILFQEFKKIIGYLQPDEKVEKDKWVSYPVESLLDYLTALSFVSSKNPDMLDFKNIEELIRVIKKALFELCDLDTLPLSNKISEDVKNILSKNRYHFHERFVKKILQRPLNLRRVNLFTTNYDLAFEYAFDNLGVKYLDGFSGFNKRTFKPESFDYDIFYPGSTTQGKVHRIEKVLKYYKLHGSLTWISEKPEPQNIYGIKEYPIDYIRSKKGIDDGIFGGLMIYPSATKKTYTLEYPYSELFRQFANAIVQQQSVLITYGYSFADEHINDIIYQSLSIPSFTLIVIDYFGAGANDKPNENIRKLLELDDPRIIIIQGENYGDFPFFVQNLLPDLVEIDNEIKLSATLKQLYEDNKGAIDNNNQSPDPVNPIIP